MSLRWRRLPPALPGSPDHDSAVAPSTGLFLRLPSLRAGVVRSTLQSIVAGFIGQAALFVSGILVARALGPEERGYLALVALVPLIITVIGMLGLDLAMVYYVSRDPSRSRSIASKLRIPALLQGGILAAIHAAAVLVMVRNGPTSFRVAGLVSLTVVPAMVAQDYGLALLQGLRRFTSFNVLRLMPVVLYSVALLAAILLGFDSLVEIALVWTAASVLSGLVALIAGMRALPRHGEGDGASPRLGELARFGIKALLGSASPVETFRLDLAFTGLFLAPADLGLYVAAVAFTNLPRFIAHSVGTVAYPHVAAEADPVAARRKAWQFFWATLLLSSAISVGLALLAGRMVPLLFGADFAAAVSVVQILLVGAVLLSGRRILAEGMRGAGYPAANSIAEAASWLWLFPALAILVPRFGLDGVAVAITTAAAFSLLVLLASVGTIRRSGRPSGTLRSSEAEAVVRAAR